MKKMNKKGFTIVELVIVIAVIAILAAVLIPTFSGAVKKANESAALQAARNAMTEDLVLADANYDNMNKDEYKYPKAAVTAENFEELKESLYEKETTYAVTDDGSFDEESVYYVKVDFAGTYADGKYTFVDTPYTCVFDVEEGGWTVTKAGN